MKVRRVVPSGYCKGVLRAIRIVKKARKDYPAKPIYVLGMIVHNRFVVDAFSNMGIITLDDTSLTKAELIETIDEGVVVFTAHGISDQIRQHAIDKGLTVIDASCEYVLVNQFLIKNYIKSEYEVIYIGKKGHPEAEAACSISSKVHLVSTKEDINALVITNEKLVVTTQTTMSIRDTAILLDYLKAKYPDIELEDEICSATRMRQEAVMTLTDVDCLIVVGDPHSNNTAQLAAIGRNSGIEKVLAIEMPEDLKDIDFSGYENIAVTAGASTPRLLTDNVIEYLKTGDEACFEIPVDKILDY